MGEIRKLITETEFKSFVDIIANAYTGIMKNSPSEKQTFMESLIKNQIENPSLITTAYSEIVSLLQVCVFIIMK